MVVPEDAGDDEQVQPDRRGDGGDLDVQRERIRTR